MAITKEKRSSGKEIENIGVWDAILDVVIYSRKEVKVIVIVDRERERLWWEMGLCMVAGGRTGKSLEAKL